MNFQVDHGFGLGEGGSGSAPDAVWRELSRAVGWPVDGPPANGPQLAELLNKSSLTPAQLYDRLSELTGDDQPRVSELVRLIEPARLARAIAAGQNISERKRLLNTFTGSLTVPAVLALLRAASYAYKQQFSPVMIALVGKAARLAQSPAATADQREAFRDFVQGIFEAWSADSVDMTSTGYESLFSTAPMETEKASDDAVTPEPERLMALSFESGAVGSPVWNALAKLVRSDQGIRQVINMLKAAPEESRAAEMVAHQFATPSRLAMLLREENVDLAAVDVLLARMLESAGGTLLDALIDAPTPKMRNDLLSRMAAIGPAICDLAVERLQSETRPNALRDLLAVLRKTYCDVTHVALEKFIRHEDVRVRREALWLLFEDPVQRDRAVVAALRDPDIEMLKVGLKAARDGLPEAAVPMLAKRVVDAKFPPEFRTSVLQLLARSQSVLALEVLLAFAVGGKTLLGKQTLAAKSPEMLIALSGLARMWSHERRVADLLERAAKSPDPEIVAALTASQGQAPMPELENVDDE